MKPEVKNHGNCCCGNSTTFWKWDCPYERPYSTPGAWVLSGPWAPDKGQNLIIMPWGYCHHCGNYLQAAGGIGDDVSAYAFFARHPYLVPHLSQIRDKALEVYGEPVRIRTNMSNWGRGENYLFFGIGCDIPEESWGSLMIDDFWRWYYYELPPYVHKHIIIDTIPLSIMELVV